MLGERLVYSALPTMNRKVCKLLALCLALPLFLLSCGREDGERQEEACAVIVRPGESIQAAIDAASQGVVICLAEGTWNEHLVIGRPLTLRGEGREKTVIQGVGSMRPVVRVEDAGEVVVENLAISGGLRGHLSDEDPGAGLLVAGDTQALVRFCSLGGNALAGLLVRDGALARVEDSSLSGNARFGLVSQDQAEVDLVGVVIAGNGGGGVWASGESHVQLAAARIANNAGAGLWLRDGAVGEVEDTVFMANEGQGLRVQEEARASVHASRIVDSGLPGVMLADSARAELKYTEFVGNWDGVAVEGQASVLVEGCELTRSRWNAVRLTGTGDAVVRDSVLEWGKTGVSLLHSGTAALVDNEVRGFTVAGVSSFGGAVEGTGNKMEGNAVDMLGNVQGSLRVPLREATLSETVYPHEDHPSLQHAIDALVAGGILTILTGAQEGTATLGKQLEISGEPEAALVAARGGLPVLSLVGGADLLMRGVRVVGDSEGITAGANAQVELVDCVVRDGEAGILLWDTASASLRDCEVLDNTDTGIRIWDEAQATVEGSTLRGNLELGVGAEGSASLRVRTSTIAQSGRGISLAGSAEGVVEETVVSDSLVGVAVEWSAAATLTECVISNNKALGVQVLHAAQATLNRCVVSGNGGDGIQLRHAARVSLEENRVLASGRYGVAAVEVRFTGYVSGRGNVVLGPGDPEGNAAGAVSPEELSFLMSEQGGEFGRDG